jgi:hypothetical protein
METHFDTDVESCISLTLAIAQDLAFPGLLKGTEYLSPGWPQEIRSGTAVAPLIDRNTHQDICLLVNAYFRSGGDIEPKATRGNKISRDRKIS